MRCGVEVAAAAAAERKKCLLSAAKASQRLTPCMNEVCRAQPAEGAAGRREGTLPIPWRGQTLPALRSKSALSCVSRCNPIPKRERERH